MANRISKLVRAGEAAPSHQAVYADAGHAYKHAQLVERAVGSAARAVRLLEPAIRRSSYLEKHHDPQATWKRRTVVEMGQLARQLYPDPFPSKCRDEMAPLGAAWKMGDWARINRTLDDAIAALLESANSADSAGWNAVISKAAMLLASGDPSMSDAERRRLRMVVIDASTTALHHLTGLAAEMHGNARFAVEIEMYKISSCLLAEAMELEKPGTPPGVLSKDILMQHLSLTEAAAELFRHCPASANNGVDSSVFLERWEDAADYLEEAARRAPELFERPYKAAWYRSRPVLEDAFEVLVIAWAWNRQRPEISKLRAYLEAQASPGAIYRRPSILMLAGLTELNESFRAGATLTELGPQSVALVNEMKHLQRSEASNPPGGAMNQTVKKVGPAVVAFAWWALLFAFPALAETTRVLDSVR
jgi:hypothetical protein